MGDGGREPYHNVIAESVRQLLKAIRDAEPEQLEILRQLIDQRRRLIESELAFERMMQPEQPMPPLLSNMYSLDFLGQEEEPVKLYTKLLNQLDDAASKVDRMLSELNRDTSASDL